MRYPLLAFFFDPLPDILWKIANQELFSHCPPLGRVDSSHASRISLEGNIIRLLIAFGADDVREEFERTKSFEQSRSCLGY